MLMMMMMMMMMMFDTLLGGYIVLVSRSMLFEPGCTYEKMEPLMDQLEREGRWRKVRRDILPSGYLTKLQIDAIVWVYQKM